MKKYFHIAILFSAFGIFHTNAESIAWNGSYIYEAALGDTVGGDSAVITYTLVVASNKCEITIEGFQASESIICKTKELENKLDVNFHSYSDGSVKNKYGISLYKVGGLLFRLNRTDNLTTTWGDLLPDEKLAKEGHYFIKELASKKI